MSFFWRCYQVSPDNQRSSFLSLSLISLISFSGWHKRPRDYYIRYIITLCYVLCHANPMTKAQGWCIVMTWYYRNDWGEIGGYYLSDVVTSTKTRESCVCAFSWRGKLSSLKLTARERRATTASGASKISLTNFSKTRETGCHTRSTIFMCHLISRRRICNFRWLNGMQKQWF